MHVEAHTFVPTTCDILTLLCTVLASTIEDKACDVSGDNNLIDVITCIILTYNICKVIARPTGVSTDLAAPEVNLSIRPLPVVLEVNCYVTLGNYCLCVGELSCKPVDSGDCPVNSELCLTDEVCGIALSCRCKRICSLVICVHNERCVVCLPVSSYVYAVCLLVPCTSLCQVGHVSIIRLESACCSCLAVEDINDISKLCIPNFLNDVIECLAVSSCSLVVKCLTEYVASISCIVLELFCVPACRTVKVKNLAVHISSCTVVGEVTDRVIVVPNRRCVELVSSRAVYEVAACNTSIDVLGNLVDEVSLSEIVEVEDLLESCHVVAVESIFKLVVLGLDEFDLLCSGIIGSLVGHPLTFRCFITLVLSCCSVLFGVEFENEVEVCLGIRSNSTVILSYIFNFGLFKVGHYSVLTHLNLLSELVGTLVVTVYEEINETGVTCVNHGDLVCHIVNEAVTEERAVLCICKE